MNFNTERYLFMLNRDMEIHKNEDRFVFSDELCEYTFVPYLGELRDISEYKKNKNAFEKIRIFVVLDGEGRLRRVPCNIWEAEKKVYIKADDFNKYWKIISERIYSALRTTEAKNFVVRQADVNQYVDLSLVETPYRTAEIDKHYKIAYKGKQKDIGTQRMISKKAQALTDHNIRYVFSSKDDVVHDKTCWMAERIPYEEFDASQKFPEGRRLCPYCKKQLYIRRAIGEDTKNYPLYVRMFECGKVNFGIIERLLAEKGAKLHMETSDIMMVTCKEDTWKIEMDEEGKCMLYHNNYKRISDTERFIMSGFHLQKNYTAPLYEFLKYIENYDWQKHVEMKKAAQVVEERIVEEEVVQETVQEAIQEKEEQRIVEVEQKENVSMLKRLLGWMKKILLEVK